MPGSSINSHDAVQLLWLGWLEEARECHQNGDLNGAVIAVNRALEFGCPFDYVDTELEKAAHTLLWCEEYVGALAVQLHLAAVCEQLCAVAIHEQRDQPMISQDNLELLTRILERLHEQADPKDLPAVGDVIRRFASSIASAPLATIL